MNSNPNRHLSMLRATIQSKRRSEPVAPRSGAVFGEISDNCGDEGSSCVIHAKKNKRKLVMERRAAPAWSSSVFRSLSLSHQGNARFLPQCVGAFLGTMLGGRWAWTSFARLLSVAWLAGFAPVRVPSAGKDLRWWWWWRGVPTRLTWPSGQSCGLALRRSIGTDGSAKDEWRCGHTIQKSKCTWVDRSWPSIRRVSCVGSDRVSMIQKSGKEITCLVKSTVQGIPRKDSGPRSTVGTNQPCKFDVWFGPPNCSNYSFAFIYFIFLQAGNADHDITNTTRFLSHKRAVVDNSLKFQHKYQMILKQQ